MHCDIFDRHWELERKNGDRLSDSAESTSLWWKPELLMQYPAPTQCRDVDDALDIGDFCFPAGLPSRLVPSSVAEEMDGAQLSSWNDLEVVVCAFFSVDIRKQRVRSSISCTR